MKKIAIFLLAIPALLLSCQSRQEYGPMKGVYYSAISGSDETLQLLPSRTRTLELRAYAQDGAVSDKFLTMSFKADPESVPAYNSAHGTAYPMLPGAAFEIQQNNVMIPRYGKASSTAKLRINAASMEEDIVYLLPITIGEVKGSDNWALGTEAVSYVTVRRLPVDPSTGDGSAALPFIIDEPADILAISEKLEEGVVTHFRMINDVDMAGMSTWIPLNYASPYEKRIDFNGDGHTIYNFSSDFPNYSSFFGVLVGKCYNVNFVNANISSDGASACAVLCGYAGTGDKAAEIDNVHVSGTVTLYGNKTGVGGLCGILGNAKVTRSSANCKVSSKYNYVGGLFGYDGGTCEVSDCWSAGTVEAGQRAGGLCGGIIKHNSTITNCYSTATVTAGFGIGGIAGHCNLDQKEGTPAESRPDNVFRSCIAWNDGVVARNKNSGDVSHYSCGAVIGFTSMYNYLIDCYRKPDMYFQDYSDMFAVYDQPNASPDSPLVIQQVSGADYNYPYHGKAAAAGISLSQLARSLGWSEDIWDFSADIPVHKGATITPDPTPGPGPDDPQEDATGDGQIDDYDENVIL